MRTSVLCLLLLLPGSVHAQSYPDAYRRVSVEAFAQLQQALAPRTFRLSPASAAGIDGLEKTASEAVSVPGGVDWEHLYLGWRAGLPAAVAALAAKIAPYSSIGSIVGTRQATTDPVSQTPDALVILDPCHGPRVAHAVPSDRHRGSPPATRRAGRTVGL